MLKALWVFVLFASGNIFFTITTFWQIKNAKNLTLLGIKFSSLWTFWLGYRIILLPAFFIINYIFTYAYWYGYNVAFEEKAWQVQLVIWLQSILTMFFIAWFYLGELPAKNIVIALFFLFAAIIAIIWK